MVRCFSLSICLAGLLMVLAGPAVSAGSVLAIAPEGGPQNGQEFLDLVSADLAAGLVTVEEALLYRFQYGFAPTDLPARYHVPVFSPLRCATAMIDEFNQERTRLSAETVATIDGWLSPVVSKAQYLSPSGRFNLAFEIVGTNAVPLEDVDPANGIPDFVEKTAQYFDECWTVEVDESGFKAPPLVGGVYNISFESMQYYGYTSVLNTLTGQTRIVMHNSYVGFPANDDPAGSIAGAAKVTAAHEFKHATQYAATRWSEGGWIELDATWAEELVYDEVNDYYNYLPGESPMRHPEVSLDAGGAGSGSYEDCVWQSWLTESWGLEIVQDFWHRRELNSGEPVLETYAAVLAERGVSLAEGWAFFTAWNYGVGARAVPGVGYEEGAAYPEGPVVDTAAAYPFATSGSLEHLAADFVRLNGFDENSSELLHVVFDGQDFAGPLTLALHITKRDGTGLIEIITLDEANDADHYLALPVREVASAGLIVGNAAPFGLSVDWAAELNLVPIPARAVASLDQVDIIRTLIEGEMAQDVVRLTNIGEPGSLLQFSAQVWTTHPDSNSQVTLTPPPLVTKSMAGSTLLSVTKSYLPGQLLNLDFVVYNGTRDDEWITDLSFEFPPGVAVLVASDFVGGSLGDLVHDGVLGDGATVNWHGVFGDEGYGVVREGEYAYGTLQVLVDPAFSGLLEIPWTLVGDQYGATPHQFGGVMTLSEDDPVLTLKSPDGGEIIAVGDTVAVTWSTGGQVPTVSLDLSRDGGQSWHPVLLAMPNSGSHAVVLPGPPSNNCLLRIMSADGMTEDVSDGAFHLYESPKWVTGAPAAGSLLATEYQDLTLAYDTSDLDAGTHQAWLVILHSGLELRTVMPVSLQVNSDLSLVAPSRAFAVNGAHPNPFNPQTTISFEIPATATTTVDVLDVRGRLVRRLYQGSLVAGLHQRTWDGRDDAGRVASAGVYLVRVRAGRHDGTAKVLLTK